MSLPIFPRDGAYIIERDKRPPERKVGSLILKEDTDRLMTTGIVRGGVGQWLEGSRVYFSPYGGYTLLLDGKEYIQMAEHEILGSFYEDAEVYVA